NYFNPATDGSQYLVFNYADLPSGGSFTTPNINAAKKGTYSLAFDYGNFGDCGTIQTLVVTVRDTITSSLLLNETINDSTPAIVGALSKYTFNFTGQGNPISIKFLDTTANSFCSDGILDNIRVSFETPATETVVTLTFSSDSSW